MVSCFSGDSDIKLKHLRKPGIIIFPDHGSQEVEKTETGFSAFAEDMAVYTNGKTMAELIIIATEPVNIYFEESDQTFSPTLHSQYVHGKLKPSDAQTRKILPGIRQIGKELSDIILINK